MLVLRIGWEYVEHVKLRNVDLFVYFYDIQVYFNLYLFDESVKFICVYVCVENLLICVWIEE